MGSFSAQHWLEAAARRVLQAQHVLLDGDPCSRNKLARVSAGRVRDVTAITPGHAAHRGLRAFQVLQVLSFPLGESTRCELKQNHKTHPLTPNPQNPFQAALSH